VHRFYVPEPLESAAEEVPLPDGAARQVGTVLRMRAGDHLVLFDGRGGEWDAELTRVDRRHAAARLLRRRPGRPESNIRVVLCQALLKGDKLDWVVQKATELGVAEITPLTTDRTVLLARGGATLDRRRSERWWRIAVEAAEQSGRVVVPTVCAPRPFRQAMDGGAAVLCWEGERERHFRDAFDAAVSAGGGSVQLFIGPEGGFTDEEVGFAAAAGAQIATLGAATLRSETAAIAAAALALLGRSYP
jgi:16S rRNA (uracil1498-N3)-methyltransferase